MVRHSGTALPLPRKDLDSSVVGNSDTTEDGEQSLPFHKLPLLSPFPFIPAVPGLRFWYGPMGRDRGLTRPGLCIHRG